LNTIRYKYNIGGLVKIGTVVTPTGRIAYWWRYNIGVVVSIDDTTLSRPHTHQILWDDGSTSYERPYFLKEVVDESR
jgi:hypothetical protein